MAVAPPCTSLSWLLTKLATFWEWRLAPSAFTTVRCFHHSLSQVNFKLLTQIPPLMGRPLGPRTVPPHGGSTALSFPSRSVSTDHSAFKGHDLPPPTALLGEVH